MSSTSLYALDDFKSCDPHALDAIWESVKQYRSICQDKHALQVEILRELDELEREAELEVETARMALTEIRIGRQVTMADRGGSSTRACGNQEPGERPAITDLDGPREGPIRNGEIVSRGVEADRSAANTPNLPPCTRVGAPSLAMPSLSPRTSIFPAASAPDVESSCLPADGSVFDKYEKMIAALRTRSPPITLSFIPREEIPWPLLPSDGIYPVALSGKKQIELDKIAEFAASYALWKGKPMGKTLISLLGHWISMDKRLKKASEHMGQEAPEASSEVSKTRHWIVSVRSKLYYIVAEQDPSVFIAYEQLMTDLVQGGYQPSVFQTIPWPILPVPGENYPVPVSGACVKRRQIDRFVRAYGSWKSCSKADIYARMLPEWEALHTSFVACDDRTKKCIKGVVNYLAESP